MASNWLIISLTTNKCLSVVKNETLQLAQFNSSYLAALKFKFK